LLILGIHEKKQFVSNDTIMLVRSFWYDGDNCMKYRVFTCWHAMV